MTETLFSDAVPGTSLNERQAEAIGHLAALFGKGIVRPYPKEVLDWVSYRTEVHYWLVDENGRVVGWDDIE